MMLLLLMMMTMIMMMVMVILVRRELRILDTSPICPNSSEKPHQPINTKKGCDDSISNAVKFVGAQFLI